MSTSRVLLIVVASCAAACGRSHVSMLVVQPALINARPYGGTVSVAGFAATSPAFAEVAMAYKRELEQAIMASPGGAVKLAQYGGGLQVAGEVRDYSLHLDERSRIAKCSDSVVVSQAGGSKSETVMRDCVYHRYDWTARAWVDLRVTAGQGQVLYVGPVGAEKSGKTSEERGRLPLLPNGAVILNDLRAVVVQRMAEIVAPTHVRVTASLFDCAKPAHETCDAGVAQLAKSNYAGAHAAFSDAIKELEGARAPKEEVAKAYFNRAVVSQYARWFDGAVADYKQAHALDDDSEYLAGLREVEAARARHQTLMDQGLLPKQ
jgi:hypothetical protein